MPGPFECVVSRCGESFEAPSELRAHVKKHVEMKHVKKSVEGLLKCPEVCLVVSSQWMGLQNFGEQFDHFQFVLRLISVTF